jgi:hypothetical protein
MKLTVIISTRDELPQNLNRTMTGLMRHGADVKLIYDHPSMGCGWRRHEGILAVKTEGVFLCDGHMEFSDGYFETLRHELDRTPGDLLCTRMQSVGHDWRVSVDSLGQETVPYFGAEIVTRDKWQREQYIPIVCK